jgi:hypothetical protein
MSSRLQLIESYVESYPKGQTKESEVAGTDTTTTTGYDIIY